MTGPDLRYPLSALVSFHYYPRPEQAARLHTGGLRLIGDSGAFSALTLGKPVNLDDYAAWCHAVEPYTTWVAGLDEIGNADETWRRWEALRAQGVESIPTVHYGASPREVDRYVEQGVDLIGMGGMVGRKSEQSRLMRWAIGMMRYARANHPQLRFHGWGITHPALVNGLPWYSVDSSGFGQAYRFGRLNIWNPEKHRNEKAILNGRDVYRLGPLLRRHYGTDPAAVATSTAANRPLIIRVSARAFQLQEDYLRARHHVSAPSYATRDPHAGTNLHAVDGSIGNLAALLGVHAALSGEHRHLGTETGAET